MHDVRPNLLGTILHDRSLLAKLSNDHADGVDLEAIRSGVEETLVGVLACVMIADVR
jgi:hypothetical protein